LENHAGPRSGGPPVYSPGERCSSLKIANTAEGGGQEMDYISLKGLVGERGFEPPTPWSRTRFQSLVNHIEACGF
jgi:hypothetical protein